MKQQTRLLLAGTAALVALMVVGLVLQAIRNLLWDLSYWLPPWLVGPVLLIGAVLLVAALIQFGVPLVRRWKQGRRTQGTGASSPVPPSNRRDAARQSLESVDRLLARLQDDVARQSLPGSETTQRIHGLDSLTAA